MIKTSTMTILGRGEKKISSFLNIFLVFILINIHDHYHYYHVSISSPTSTSKVMMMFTIVDAFSIIRSNTNNNNMMMMSSSTQKASSENKNRFGGFAQNILDNLFNNKNKNGIITNPMNTNQDTVRDCIF